MYDPLVLGICLFSLLKIKLIQNFVNKRNMQHASSLIINVRNAVSLKIQQFQIPLMGALKSDFSRNAQISRF